ncbi:receptor subunit 1 [Seminavis robusta]|uniref:Receptor subunit 1 n=1 Tax=Seminavis robusta TaxID=568900 RepID=A0A9N8DNC6_9STRA|nr:receptor subunit 1 [Seminavis robusta]|eukprot:Sro224_g091510.1 receptor subunit 1 (673) ;mRNA; f:2609-4845
MRMHQLFVSFGALCIILLLFPSLTEGIGEKPAFKISPLSEGNATYRSDVCDRFNQFSDGKISLRHALSGLALRPIMEHGDFFHFSHDQGIDPVDPGFLGELMDILAARANFTWRDSFAIMWMPDEDWTVLSWTDYLVWSVNHFDISVTWWDHSIERMEKGVAFVEPWYDGSLVLINQHDPPIQESSIVLSNWLLPFDASVWMLIITTIIASALVYQLIEFMNDEREERSMYQWFSDNLYLSSLNFSQNFEYAPNSLAGRIFGISMSIWALVITATYTANLASLLVQHGKQGLVIDSIERAMVANVPICTYGGSNSDTVIQNKYQKAIRRPMETELLMYQALRQGQCGLAVTSMDTWLTYFSNEDYNPDCDLEWVGRQLLTIKSGFAVKADSGDLCSSLIRDVLNLHLAEIVGEGILEELWRKHRAKLQTIDCDAQESGDRNSRARRGLLSSSWFSNQDIPPQQRSLKGGGSTTAASSSSSSSGGAGETSSLSIESMLGTFVMHWSAMAVALLVSVLSVHFERWQKKRLEAANCVVEQVRFRGHGPIIGMPPRMNTFVIRNKHDVSLGGSERHEAEQSISQDEEGVIKPGISAFRRLSVREASRRFPAGLNGQEQDMQWRQDVDSKLERLLKQERKLERLLNLVEGMSNLSANDANDIQGAGDITKADLDLCA